MPHKGGVALMYQSRASIATDLGASGGPSDLADTMTNGVASLFIQVDDLDEVVAALGETANILIPLRRTFYGMDELFVQAPCGTIIGFAAKLPDDAE
jgi:hypothetical protein